jgi:hypothetical protein
MIAPIAISSLFDATASIVVPAVSQLFMRSSPRSRWKLATCFSTIFIPGYFATTSSTAFVRSCAPLDASSPTMIATLPRWFMSRASSSISSVPACESSEPTKTTPFGSVSSEGRRLTYTSGTPASRATLVMLGVADVSAALTMSAATPCATKFWM